MSRFPEAADMVNGAEEISGETVPGQVQSFHWWQKPCFFHAHVGHAHRYKWICIVFISMEHVVVVEPVRD